jgi:hypothetical protein
MDILEGIGVSFRFVVLISSFILPANVFAWKPNTHVYSANIILADAQAGFPHA